MRWLEFGAVNMNLKFYGEFFIHLALVVQTLDSAIHWINLYPADNAIGFPNIYPLDSDISGWKHYPLFAQ